MVVSFDEETKNARLSLRQSEILTQLAKEEAEAIAAMPGAAWVACGHTCESRGSDSRPRRFIRENRSFFTIYGIDAFKYNQIACRSLNSIQSMAATCSSQRLARRTEPA